MRSLLVFIFLLACVSAALAIEYISKIKKDEIQEQIFLAQRMDTPIGQARGLMEDAIAERKSPEEIARLRQALLREVDKQNAARTKAVHLTLDAYHLWPEKRRGISVMPGTNGREIQWLPVAREREARQIQDGSGNVSKRAQPREDAAGRTYFDGVTYLDPAAFQWGVGYLASTLLHERIHFEQYTTRGRGDALTKTGRQLEAFQAEVDNQKYFFDPLNAKDARDLAEDKAEMGRMADRLTTAETADKAEKEARKGLLGAIRRLKDYMPSPEMSDEKLHTPEELKAIRQEAAALETQIREEAKQRALVATRQRHLDYLHTLANRLCEDPGGVTQDDFDRLEYVPDRNFYWREADRVIKSGEFFSTCWGSRYGAILQDLQRGTKPVAQSYKAMPMPEYVPPPVEALPSVPDVQIPLPKQQPPPLFDSDLAALAEKACSGGVTAEDLKKFGWFPMPHVNIDEGRYRRSRLSGCALSVFEYLCKLNAGGGNLDAAAINAQAGQSGQSGQGGQGGQGGDEGGRQQPDSRRRDWSKEPNPPYIKR